MCQRLPALARDLKADDRTLRRAVARGSVRCRAGAGPMRIDHAEHEYLIGHWHLIARLTALLRTEPNVRLAVLFGSVARGDETDASDVDLLVDVRGESLERLGRLRRRVRGIEGRGVQLVSLAAASPSASLMSAIVEDGRVLADRDAVWPAWRERFPELRAGAERANERAEARARAVFAYYRRAGRQRRGSQAPG